MTKRIELSDDAYEALTAARRPGENFSEVVRRLVKTHLRHRSISESAGTWPMNAEESDRLTKEIYTQRNKSGGPP